MTEKPKLSPDELQAVEAIKGVLAVAASNFPRATTVRIVAEGSNSASITLPDYLLSAIIKAAGAAP